MRYAKMLVLVLLCLNTTVHSQSILQTTVKGNYNKTPVSFILKDLQKRYRINFFYTNNLPSLSKVISIQFEKKELKNILNEIFNKTEITYEVIGGHIVLKKLIISKVAKRTSGFIPAENLVVTASLTDSVAFFSPSPGYPLKNLVIVSDSSKKKNILKSTADTNALVNGLSYYKISATSKEELDKKYIEAKNSLEAQYKILSDSLSLNNNQKSKNIKSEILDVLNKMEIEIKRISDTLTKKINIQGPIIKNDEPDSMGFTYHPLALKILPGIGTNEYEDGKAVNNVSLNLLGGSSAGLEGVEVAGLFNIEKEYMHGTQYAGIMNYVRNDVTGAQFSSMLNIAGGPVHGAQVSGTLNMVSDSITGFQGSGFANIATGNFKGVQAAGFLNFVSGNMEGSQLSGFINMVSSSEIENIDLKNDYKVSQVKGFQASGFANINHTDIIGVQAAGFLNYARKVKGAQIGIVNFADSVNGVQIGLLSFNKKGYNHLEIFGSETKSINIAFKLGGNRFYNIFTAGMQLFDSPVLNWSVGYGIGTEFNMGKSVKLNIDAVCNQLNENNKWSDFLNLNNQLKLIAGFQFAKHFTLYGGPTWNVLVSGKKDAQGRVTGPDIVPHTLFNQTNFKTNVQMWPGFNLGIRI